MQNGVNKITKPLKWNENGGEKENSKPKTKTKTNWAWKRKWNGQNVATNLYDGERVKWSWIRMKWRSQTRKKAAGTVQEEGANSSGSIKVKVKTRWGVKLGAPRRLWAPNRRGTYPNFTPIFHFSNKVTMTSVTWSKPTSWETSPCRLANLNRRGASAPF